MLGAKAVVLAVLAVGSLAAVDFVDSLQQEFKMGMILPRQSNNLQTFNGALGGVQASAIIQTNDPKRPFSVNGDTFTDFKSAANRACDEQHNKCADVANSNKKGSLTVSDCDEQNSECKAQAQSQSGTQTAATALVSSNADFDFFCEV